MCLCAFVLACFCACVLVCLCACVLVCMRAFVLVRACMRERGALRCCRDGVLDGDTELDTLEQALLKGYAELESTYIAIAKSTPLDLCLCCSCADHR